MLAAQLHARSLPTRPPLLLTPPAGQNLPPPPNLLPPAPPQLIGLLAGFKYGVTRWLVKHTNLGVAWLFNVGRRTGGGGAGRGGRGMLMVTRRVGCGPAPQHRHTPSW